MVTFTSQLCYSSGVNTSFIWWGKADFGLCLQNTALVSVTSLLFAMVSGFYCTWMYTSLQRRRRSVILILRMIISLALTLNSLVGLVVSFIPATGESPYSISLSACLLVLAWLIHTFCSFVFTSSIAYHGHGPYLMNTVWFLTGISSSFQFRTYLRHRSHPSYYELYEQVYFNTWHEVCVYINFSLQCLYGITLLVPISKVESYDDIKSLQSFQQGQEMRRNLITSNSFSIVSGDFSTYGAISLDKDEVTLKEAQEDSANIFSRLFFYWVNPLMVKGSLGRLQKPEDLPPLPKSLNTEKIRNRFHNILFGTVNDTDPPNPSVKMATPTLKENPYQVFSENVSVQDTSTQQQQGDEDRYSIYSNMSVLQTNNSHRPTTLFKALNKAFGLHYYSLGIVKLVNDLLGFAGPLLLHALVSYMENNNVSCVFVYRVNYFYWCLFIVNNFSGVYFRSRSLMGTIMPLACS